MDHNLALPGIGKYHPTLLLIASLTLILASRSQILSKLISQGTKHKIIPGFPTYMSKFVSLCSEGQGSRKQVRHAASWLQKGSFANQ